MDKYYFLISELPYLLFGQKPNLTARYFLEEAFKWLTSADHESIIQADINDAETVREKIKGMTFDVVADFISYGVEALEHKLNLFRGIADQYIFISSVADAVENSAVAKSATIPNLRIIRSSLIIILD